MRALAIATHHDWRKIMGPIDMEAVGFGDAGDSPIGMAEPLGESR